MWERAACRKVRFPMLEPEARKLARPVLRGGSDGNAAPVPDRGSTTDLEPGTYSGQTFIPDSPLPHAEGAAQLIITPTTSPRSGSVADAFGTAAVLRTGDDILAQVRAERDDWGDR